MKELARERRIHALRYGDVVEHPGHGRGMIQGVTAEGALLISFEDENLCTGYQQLSYIGSIYDLPMSAYEPEPVTKPKELQ